MKIVLASNNAGKVKEFNALFASRNVEVIPQTALQVDEVEETGLTFVENAILKARHAAKVTGLPSLADDSGLVVPALNGAPGIYSARYAGKSATSKDNIQKLLQAMTSMSEVERVAHFHCTLVFMMHAEDPSPLICEGDWFGHILHQPQGADGFGYDPVFFDPTENQSAAELPLALKNKISHRGQALERLLKRLPNKL